MSGAGPGRQGPGDTIRVDLRVHGDAVRFRVRVVPRASRTGVAGVHDGALRVRLAAPPVDGKANAALVRFVSRALGVPRAGVRIVGGATGRSKVLEVAASVELVDAGIRALLRDA